jgi:hypothetical protein
VTNDFIFDLETYPNVFTATFEHADAPLTWAFEISDRRNDSRAIVEFATWLKVRGCRLVGFNNIGFDYPILHTLLRMGNADARTLYDKAMAIIQSQEVRQMYPSARALYDKAMAIIQSQDDEDRWVHQVYPSDRIIPQVDLFKIHHFDNKARATGLKALEFNMRADSIEDLPFPVGTMLTPDQIDVLLRYNRSDVRHTKTFYHHTKPMIQFREELCRKYPDKDWINFNDTKIGKEFFIQELEKAGVPCYDFTGAGRTPRQTRRPSIALRDCILPWISFTTPEFTRVLNWLKDQTITETKGVFKDLTATVNGFTFVFGLGGIHGSVENRAIESDDEWVIVDLDVTSFYPNLAITNHFYPEHLGERFDVIYKDLFEQRKKYPKKSAESAMLKLALNGTYGDSNNPFSPFYDPKFTMSITLNGQLLLCKLAEYIMRWTSAELIQVNTDGLTVRIRRNQLPELQAACGEWENLTSLFLEQNEYLSMFIRDVNNYLAHDVGLDLKRKGAYEYEVEWHQDASALVVPKVAEKVLLEGLPIRATVEQWPDIMDFMIRIKVPRSGHLQWGDDKVQNTTRYYVSKAGKPLRKWLPPLKGKTEWRGFGVCAGWTVQVCNDIKDATEPVDFDYYVAEVEKLCLAMN